MKFFKKTFLLAFLNDSELKIALYEDSSGKARRVSLDTVEFSGDAVKGGAILSFSLFYERLAEFLKTKPEFRGLKLVLVIPEEKIYIRGFELDLGDWEKKNELVRDFEKDIPFKEEELILRERLVGRVLELSAISRQFIDDFKRPFTDFHMNVAGAISIPQAAAIIFKPKERSFLLAFYDNDMAMMLAENSSIISSGTKRMAHINGKESVKAFDRFIRFAKAEHVKSVSVILRGDSIADDLKTELESAQYQIGEIKKIDILDLIASYYGARASVEKDWNMFYAESSASRERAAGRNLKIVLTGFAALLIMSVFGWFFAKDFLRQLAASLPNPYGSSPSVPAQGIENNSSAGATSTTAESSAPAPVKKEDFPVKIFNGTSVSGEAGRLREILTGRGFKVSGIDNLANQNQAVTKLMYSADIPVDIISEIRGILDSRYQNLLPSILPAAEKGIEIIVGRKK